MLSPKPILKRAVSEQVHKTGPPHGSHGVHFPPCPATSTFAVYSAAAYDRSPIIVAPNSCALPERGGRTYNLEESQPRRGISYARDFHPRALAFASSRSSSPHSSIDATINERHAVYPPLPSLIPDLSSESDESDGFSGPPTLSPSSPPTFGIHGLAGPSLKYDSDYLNFMDGPNTLAFLPHPPSPPSCYKSHYYPESVDPFPQNYRRRRGERESKRDSSRDPDRIPSNGVDLSSLSISSSPTSTPKKRSTKRRLPHTTPTSLGFGNLDDGCLGGF